MEKSVRESDFSFREKNRKTPQKWLSRALLIFTGKKTLANEYNEPNNHNELNESNELNETNKPNELNEPNEPNGPDEPNKPNQSNELLEPMYQSA